MPRVREAASGTRKTIAFIISVCAFNGMAFVYSLVELGTLSYMILGVVSYWWCKSFYSALTDHRYVEKA